MKKIPIFFSFDNNYVPQAAVTFESLLSTAFSDVFYELIVVHSEITKDNIQKLHKQVSLHNNATLSFIDINGRFDFSFSDELFTTKSSDAIFTIETLYRCIPTLLPELDKYDKIIYSDVDIVVVDDISDLYDIDLSNSYLAGVSIPDFLSGEVCHLPKTVQDTYIAGGLWVMNLQKMREDNLNTNILSIINKPPCKLLWNDQDVINLACSPKISFFSYRYISIPDWLPILEQKSFFDRKYPNFELHDAMYRPKIIHYAGIKPWNKNNRPLKSDLWYYWLSKTEFRDNFDNQADRKPHYTVYLFGIIPLFFSKVKIRPNSIKIKLLKIIPLIRIKIKHK